MGSNAQESRVSDGAEPLVKGASAEDAGKQKQRFAAERRVFASWIQGQSSLTAYHTYCTCRHKLEQR